LQRQPLEKKRYRRGLCVDRINLQKRGNNRWGGPNWPVKFWGNIRFCCQGDAMRLGSIPAKKGGKADQGKGEQTTWFLGKRNGGSLGEELSA